MIKYQKLFFHTLVLISFVSCIKKFKDKSNSKTFQFSFGRPPKVDSQYKIQTLEHLFLNNPSFEFRVLMIGLLEASKPGKSEQESLEDFDTALNFLKKYYKMDKHVVKINSLESYYDKLHQNIPPQGSLEAEFDFLKKNPRFGPINPIFASPAVKDDVLYMERLFLDKPGFATFNQEIFQKIRKVTKSTSVSDLFFNEIFSYFYSEGDQLDNIKRKQAIFFFAKIKIQENLRKISSIGDAVSSMLAQKNSQKFNPQVFLLETLLGGYFKDLPIKVKYDILADFSARPIQKNLSASIGILIDHSGPIMLKTLQLLAREVKNPLLTEILKKTESSNRPLSQKTIKKIIAEIPDDFKIHKKSLKRLGTGSMAEAYLVTKNRTPHDPQEILDGDDNTIQVVLRVIKPSAYEKFYMDKKIIYPLTRKFDQDPRVQAKDMPSLEKIFSDLAKNIAFELDLEKTVQMQNEARVNFQKNTIVKRDGWTGIVAVKVPYAYDPIGRYINFQEYMQGSNFSDEVSSLPKSVKLLCNENLASIWLENAIFLADGVIHGDMHDGNVLADITTDLNRQTFEAKLSIIDFGMSQKFTAKERVLIMKIAIASFLQDAEGLAEGLSNLSLKQMDKNKLKTLIMKTINNAQTPPQNPGYWISWTIENQEGIFPSAVLDFARSNKLITRKITHLNKLGLLNLIRQMKLNTKKNIVQNLIGGAIGIGTFLGLFKLAKKRGIKKLNLTSNSKKCKIN